MNLIAGIILFVGFFITPQIWASDSTNAIVKIQSAPCRGSSLDLASEKSGTGILIRHDQQVYVLTSDHVVFHENSGFCHRFRMRQGGSFSARLVQAEWGHGLALLKSEASDLLQERTLPTLNDIDDSPVAIQQKVTLGGFPHRSKTLLLDPEAIVVNPSSERIPLGLESPTIELKGLAEYGMSGGPVFDETGSRILGLLSHQILILQPGQPSSTGDWTAQNATVNRVFAIPGATIKGWMEAILSSHAPPVFTVPPSPSEVKQVLLGQILFRFEKAPLPNTTPVQSSIGGGDGTGIGGGDGTGIGGDSEPASFSKEATISLAFSATGAPLSRGIQKKLGVNDWYEEALSRLLRREELSIARLILPQSYRAASFSSLEAFFSAARQGALPVFLSSNPFKTSATRKSPEIQDLRRIISGLRLTSIVKDLTDRIVTASFLVLQYGLLPKELRITIEGHSGWNELYATDFDRAVELRSFWYQLIP